MTKTIWMVKSETEEYGTVYMPEHAAITESQLRSNLYFEFLQDDDLPSASVKENLDDLGWDIVEVEILEVAG